MPPCSTTVAPGSAGASARRPASTRSSSACDQARTSTAKRPAAGTVLDVVPAVMAVGVTVVPAASSARAATAVDLVGELDRRVDALLRLEPGVGGPADHLDLVERGALAGGLQRTAVRGRLQHQGRGGS